MDEARIIAWIEGELSPEEARAVAAAVAADPALAARADRHRRLKARFRAAFGGMIEEAAKMPSPRKPAPVVSLAAARARRDAAPPAAPAGPVRVRDRLLPVAVAISLVVGIVAGMQVRPLPGIADTADALALGGALAAALDDQPSGGAGRVRIAQSFRDGDGAWCRDFAGASVAGTACRNRGRWRLRYALHGAAGAGGAARPRVPLDAAQERAAIARGWR